MSIFQQEVKKRIGPYMKQKGFRLHNRRYYYINNNIAYCICFEQPTGWMYTWAHVTPLYSPIDFINLDYGNRLNDMSDIQLPTLGKESAPAEIDAWCELFFRSVEDHILPFFQKIDTPESLIAYVNNLSGNRAVAKLCCSPLWANKLRMYTYLYLHDLPKAETAADFYKQTAAENAYLMPSLREKLQKEADEIKLLISKGDEAVSDFCEQTISNTKKLFVKSKKS